MELHKIQQVKNVDRIIKVLFVDDDSTIFDSTKILLEQLGYIVTSAKSSSEAISASGNLKMYILRHYERA